MRNLNFELKQLCKRNSDGSFATRSNRERILTLVGNQLNEMGYRNLSAAGLKTKHIEALVNRWKEEQLGAGTIKNRMSHLRWWAEKIGKDTLVAKSNDHYGIEKRVFVTNNSKSIELDNEKLQSIKDPYTKLSLRLQEQFGLRREESIKFIASYADRGDRILLKASWTKGGREREVPIRNDEQRRLLNEVREFAGKGSLIPHDLKYIQQLKRFEDHTSKAGIHHVHGMRHAYAQQRYLELTGRPAPAAGGKTSRELSPAEKAQDRDARLTISSELGHEREQITAIYLGR